MFHVSPELDPLSLYLSPSHDRDELQFPKVIQQGGKGLSAVGFHEGLNGTPTNAAIGIRKQVDNQLRAAGADQRGRMGADVLDGFLVDSFPQQPGNLAGHVPEHLAGGKRIRSGRHRPTKGGDAQANEDERFHG